MADDDGQLRVAPAVLAGFCESLSSSAEHVQARLAELDRQVGEMLGGWRGASGGAYSAVWQHWHRGATEVQLGLSMLAGLVGGAGVAQQDNEAGSADAVRRVTDG